MRCLSWSVALLGSVLPALRAGDAPAAWSFPPDQVRFYVYTLTQDTTFASAGDTLKYTSSFTWKLGMSGQPAGPGRARVNLTGIRIQASHRGPDRTAEIDSSRAAGERGEQDPLLGGLLALHGVTLTLDLEPRTGQVASVAGGESIIANLNRLVPAAFPGEPPPLDAAARETYSPEALARWWSQALARPPADGKPQTIALGAGPTAPIAGSAERRWNGAAWTAVLPAGSDHLPVRLSPDPSPVEGKLHAFSGEGRSAAAADGWPDLIEGRLAFTLTLTALTQPVEQKHEIRWRLKQVQVQ